MGPKQDKKPDTSPPEQPIGLTLTFKRGEVFISLAIVALATLSYEVYPSFRDTLTFSFVALGITAGVLSAYYISRNLATTISQRNQGIQQRTEELHAAKVSKAFEYIDSWNHPDFHPLKEKWHEIMKSVKAQPQEKVEETLEDYAKREVVIDVLNFFEGMALAISKGIADDETLRRQFRGSLLEYYLTFEEWIKKYRRDRNRPAGIKELEHLLSRWTTDTQ